MDHIPRTQWAPSGRWRAIPLSLLSLRIPYQGVYDVPVNLHRPLIEARCSRNVRFRNFQSQVSDCLEHHSRGSPTITHLRVHTLFTRCIKIAIGTLDPFHFLASPTYFSLSKPPRP